MSELVERLRTHAENWRGDVNDTMREAADELERLAHELAVQRERDELGCRQAKAVMPCIGPLLDAWDGLATDFRQEIEAESTSFAIAMEDIARGMEQPDYYSSAGDDPDWADPGMGT